MVQEFDPHFGKYLLLDRIGSGGMAEIFRARPAALDANGRVVVIKRILPHVVDDPVFMDMFKSEIQVCMGFHHPNTVQIYDFGDVKGQSYLAMEYIDGLDLRTLMTAFKQSQRKMPIEVILGIVEQAARGLHYAHTFENSATGDKLDLIHRDVSPQNILVSYDGHVKVIDFGIAKAFGEAKAKRHLQLSEHTQTGVIKGKLSYLSPEQANQELIDCRSDVFSLGIVLWELLTLQKLFKTDGPSGLAPLQMVQNPERFILAPSAFNQDVPKELDQIVLKALARTPNDRYATADEFGNILHEFLVRHRPGFAQAEVGRLMKLWFRGRITDEKRKLVEINQRAQGILTNHKHLNKPEHGMTITEGELAFSRKNKTNWFTKGKAAGFAVYLLTIVFLKLDAKYFFFEHFFEAQEHARFSLTEPIQKRSMWLKLILPTQKVSVKGIRINDLPLDVANPKIQVPLDKPVHVVIYHGDSREFKKDFLFRSDLFAGVKSYNLNISLE